MAHAFQTKTRYEAVVEGFRRAPGNYMQAAQYAGCGWRAAKILWNRGWVKHQWARPIKDVLADEQALKQEAVGRRIRGERAVQDAQADKARAEVEQAREAEAELLGLARKNVRAAFALSAQLIPAMVGCVEVVKYHTIDPKTQKPYTPADMKIDAVQAMGLITRYGLTLQRAYGVAESLVQLEMARRGEAGQILGISQVASMTPEEAAREIEEQEVCLALIRESGQHLRLVKNPPAGAPPAPQGSNGAGRLEDGPAQDAE